MTGKQTAQWVAEVNFNLHDVNDISISLFYPKLSKSAAACFIFVFMPVLKGKGKGAYTCYSASS